MLAVETGIMTVELQQVNETIRKLRSGWMSGARWSKIEMLALLSTIRSARIRPAAAQPYGLGEDRYRPAPRQNEDRSRIDTQGTK